MHGHGDYRRLERGKRLPRAYLDPSYTVSDWSDWGFAPPGPGMRWVRYYDDGLLIDGDGRIVDACYGVAWERGPMRGPRGGFAGGRGPAIPALRAATGTMPAAGLGYPAPGVTTYRAGPNTTVTTTVVQAPPPVIVGRPGVDGYAGGYGGGYARRRHGDQRHAPASRSTTTTTTHRLRDRLQIGRASGRSVWRRPIRHYRPRCVHTPSCPILGS